MLKQPKSKSKNYSKKCEFPDCGKVFSTFSDYKAHSIIHSGIKAFICAFENCGKSFARKGDLKTHERLHTGAKVINCVYMCCCTF